MNWEASAMLYWTDNVKLIKHVLLMYKSITTYAQKFASLFTTPQTKMIK